MKRTQITIVMGLLLAATGLAFWTFPATGQQTQRDPHDKRSLLVEKVGNLPDVQHRVVEDESTPLRIVSAGVKVISGEDYSRLTGHALDLDRVSSLPDLQVTNVSDRPIVAFMFMVRDPEVGISRVIEVTRLNIQPGSSYSLLRDDMVSEEAGFVADGSGVRKEQRSKFESKNYWVSNVNHLGSYLTIGQVTFSDGSSWMISEGGEIR